MSETQQKPSLNDLRSHVAGLDAEAPVRKALIRPLAEAYQEETGGRLLDLQRRIGEWRRDRGFRTDWLNVPEKLMLVVSELGEAMEAYRHLPLSILEWFAAGSPQPQPVPSGDWCEWESNFEEEIADTLIRLLDLADALEIPIDTRIAVKMAKNELRPHKHGKEC